MPSHRREYGAGTALQLHTLLPFAVATKTSPSCSRLARRSAAAAASVAQQQRLASSSSESSRSRNLSGVVMAGASTTTEQMDMDMDALDMSLQLQLGDFQEWWPPIAASEEVVSSNNNNHHQHALPLISSNNSNIIPQQQQQHQRKCISLSSLFSIVIAISSRRQSLLLSKSENADCILDSPPAQSAASRSRLQCRSQHKGAGGRIISPCAAVMYPREGEKAASLTPPVVAAAAAVHHKKPSGGSSSGCVKRAVSQRESHIWSERQRRKGMNHLFSTLRSLLPQPSSKTDKSTVVSEIIKYIQSLQVKLDILAKKRQQMLEARALSQTVVPTVSLHHPMEPPKTSLAAAAAAVVTPENLAISLLDHQGNAHHGNHESSMLYVQQQQQQQADLAAMSANLNHPLQQQEIIQQTDSCLQSFLGANVGLHICGSNAFITISSPRGQRGIFHRILVTVQNQHLDVINAFISTSKASIFHCLHCQALQGSDLSKEELHTALQMVITNYGQSI
ncbi:unnamed protein product [Sphagnum balticum]